MGEQAAEQEQEPGADLPEPEPGADEDQDQDQDQEPATHRESTHSELIASAKWHLLALRYQECEEAEKAEWEEAEKDSEGRRVSMWVAAYGPPLPTYIQNNKST